MTSALLVLLLLSQAGGAAPPPAEAVTPPLPASSTGGWCYLTRLEATGLALLPGGGVGTVESYVQVDTHAGVGQGGGVRPQPGRPGSVAAGRRGGRWAGASGGLGQPLGLGPVGACPQAGLGHGPGGAVGGLALGLGQPGARHLYSGQVRWRFGHKLYALAEGGTLLFPEADGALRPGAFASLGLGVDNAR